MMKYTDNFNTILLPILENYLKRYGQQEIHKYCFERLNETKGIIQKQNREINYKPICITTE